MSRGEVEHPRSADGAPAGADAGEEPLAAEKTSVAGVADPAPWDRGRDRRTAAVFFLVVWVVYLATATYGPVQVNDNRAVNASAWSLATQGTLALPEQWDGQMRWFVRGADDRLYTDRFPGAVLWATPFHAVGNLFTDRGTPPHHADLSYVPGGIAAATAAALAVLVSFLALRRLADRRLAVAATVVLAFGTGVWSVSADAMWTHSLTHLTLMLGVLAAADGRHARSGLAFAAAVLTRPQTAFVPAIVGIWKGVVERRIRPVLVIGVLSAVGVAALAAYSYRYFGTLLPVAGYGEGKVTAVATTGPLVMAERVAFTLGHPMRGVLIYVPFLVVLVPFVRHGWRVSPWWVRASAVGGLVYLVVQLRSNTWHGGGSFFGNRLTLETLVLTAPLLLRTWQARIRFSERLKGACVGLMVVAIGLHAVGATFLSVHPEDARRWYESEEQYCIENPDDPFCENDGA